jgi:beta-N-acetylhexosaminidase
MMDSTGASMTLEQQIGQLFMVGFQGYEPPPEIIDLIQRWHVGGIIFFSRNIRDARQTLELTTRLQQLAREAGQPYPLLIATDQENGMVRRLGPDATLFPGNMALGATRSEEITREVAEATGRELIALGINMNLAPDADVNNNPDNPVIGVRSFGEDPALVARLTSAAVRGYQSAGVVATLKHFPGHGDTATDSHQSLPIIPYGMERLQSLELAPFKAGIAAGAESVMTAHLYLPELMPGEPHPATISPAIVTDLLRSQLGFGGVIITDCLEMSAISKTVGTAQGAVLALQAGVDLALVSHCAGRQRAGIEQVRAAVKDGKLPAERISQSVERILRLKQRRLSWEALPDASALPIVGSEAHRQLRDRAYALSTTLLRNDEKLVPLKITPQTRILVLAPHKSALSQAEDGSYPETYLAERIQQRHSQVTSLLINSWRTAAENQRILQAVTNSDLTILITINAHRDEQQRTLLRQLLHTGKPVIGVSVATPYDLAATTELHTALATYEYTQPALETAVRVLFGEIPAHRRMP